MKALLLTLIGIMGLVLIIWSDVKEAPRPLVFCIGCLYTLTVVAAVMYIP